MKTPKTPRTLGTCTVDDCSKAAFTMGLCKAHYSMKLKIDRRMKECGTVVPIGKNGKVKGGPGSGKGCGGGVAPKLVKDEPTLKRIHDLAGLHCTKEEIAGVLQVDRNTFGDFLARHREAEDAYEFGKMNGKASLRRTQFVMAKRSAAMAIFLGKNLLGQSDNLKLGRIEEHDLETGSEEGGTALLRAVRAENE